MEMRKIMDDICTELEEIEHKGLTGANWEMTAKLLEMKKNILKIAELEGYSMDAGRGMTGMNYGTGRTYDNYSGRRHRDSMGRYASAEDKMADGIMTMMERSDLSQADKDTLRRALDVIRR